MHAPYSLATVTQPVTNTTRVINHRDLKAVGLKAQKAASTASNTLTAMVMVLASVMMTGHRLIHQ